MGYVDSQSGDLQSNRNFILHELYWYLFLIFDRYLKTSLTMLNPRHPDTSQTKQ